MVACETGEEECVNGGWVHPQCTKDLCHYSREEIDKIDIWYCEDCRMKEMGDQSAPVPENQQNEMQVDTAKNDYQYQ